MVKIVYQFRENMNIGDKVFWFNSKIFSKHIYFLYMLIDIKECESEHGCQQECREVPGSYECYCESGYELEADKTSCRGKYLNRNFEGPDYVSVSFCPSGSTITTLLNFLEQNSA